MPILIPTEEDLKKVGGKAFELMQKQTLTLGNCGCGCPGSGGSSACNCNGKCRKL